MTLRHERNRDARREMAGLLAGQLHCPDCNSDAELTEQAPGVHVLTIAHDDTCPAYRAMTS